MSDRAIRICRAVSEEPGMGVLPGVVAMSCSKCAAGIWVHVEQELPEELRGVEQVLVCARCARLLPEVSGDLEGFDVQSAIARLKLLASGETHFWKVGDES